MISVQEFIHNFRNQQEQLEIDEIRQYINLKNINCLDKSNTKLMNELMYIIQVLFEEGETTEIFSIQVQLCRTIPQPTNGLNNLVVFLFNSNLIDLAKKVAKFNIQFNNIESPQIHLISYLNLARIYYFLQNYSKSLQMTERALIKYEPYIFKEMKANTMKLQKNPSEVILLLNGYLFYGKCVQNLQVVGLNEETDYNKFFANGYKLCKKYLHVGHYLTRQFQQIDKSSYGTRRNISNYISQKKQHFKTVNLKKMSLQCNQLLNHLKSLKQLQAPKKQSSQNKFIVRSMNQSDLRECQTFHSKPRSEIQRVIPIQTSPKLRELQEQTPTKIDIEQIIQKKFDMFVSTYNSKKKTDPKLLDLEKRVDILTKENLKIQQQRQEREKEIEELKERINQEQQFRLQQQQKGIELQKTESKLQEQQTQEQFIKFSQMQENLKKMDTMKQQESSPGQGKDGTFGKIVQSMKKTTTTKIEKGGNTSTDIHNLINNLTQNEETEEIKESNSISIINDTDLTLDQNLTIIDQNDSNKQYSICLSTELTIVKKTYFENQLYEIQCCMVHRNKELQLKITLIPGESNSLLKDNQRIEYVEVSIVKDLVQYIEYYKVLPHSTPIKTIRNFKTFIQYLILPFISINKDEDPKVSIYSYPQSVLQEPDKIWIFEEQCSVTLHFLEGGIFRLVIQYMSNKQLSQALIDLDFDQSSLDLFFESSFYEEYEKEEVQELIRILERNDKSNDTVKNKHRSYYVHNYLMKNQNRFMQFLEKIKSDLMEFFIKQFNIMKLADLLKILNGQQVQMPNKSQANIQYCMIKIWEKAVYQRIILIADNSREQCYEILLQNFYETHSPRSQKIKAEGYTQISYDLIRQKFGLIQSTLDQSDNQVIHYILCNLFSLDTFAKELDQDDYDRYKQNCIIDVELQCESSYRYYLNDQSQYKIPITMSYLGINNKPIGIRIQIFDEITLSEQGVFLVISANVWQKIKGEEVNQLNKKKRTIKYVLKNIMTTDYYLTQLLNQIGWQIIGEKIVIQNQNNRLYPYLSNKQATQIDRLENVLTSSNLIEILNKRVS